MNLKKSMIIGLAMAVMLIGAGCSNNNDSNDNGVDDTTPVPTESAPATATP